MRGLDEGVAAEFPEEGGGEGEADEAGDQRAEDFLAVAVDDDDDGGDNDLVGEEEGEVEEGVAIAVDVVVEEEDMEGEEGEAPEHDAAGGPLADPGEGDEEEKVFQGEEAVEIVPFGGEGDDGGAEHGDEDEGDEGTEDGGDGLAEGAEGEADVDAHRWAAGFGDGRKP